MEFRTQTASRSKTPIGPDILARAPRLSAIGAFCIGTEKVDLSACGAKGIAVFNAPYSNTRSVVEMAPGEMIMLHRGVFESSNRFHRGAWTKSSEGFHEIRGKRLGMIGCAIIDVDDPCETGIPSELEAIPDTIRARLVY